MSTATLQVCVLASGSRGNAVFISDGATTVLVDAGLSGIEIQRRLGARGLADRRIDAIVVTHEHNDHIQGVGVLSRRFKIPVYVSSPTLAAAAAPMGKVFAQHSFVCGRAFAVGRLAFHPFATSHDAADPAGFVIGCGGIKIGIATDLGIATGLVRTHLQTCDLLVLEANHDPLMLEQGPYPWPLKQRIKGRSGHLSNQDSRCLLQDLRHDGLRHVVLAHLSEINNTPEMAVAEVSQALSGRTQLHVALQDKPTPVFGL